MAKYKPRDVRGMRKATSPKKREDRPGEPGGTRQVIKRELAAAAAGRKDSSGAGRSTEAHQRGVRYAPLKGAGRGSAAQKIRDKAAARKRKRR